MQALSAVEVVVLAGVEYVEPGRPEHDDEREQEWHRTVERAADSNPCAGRGNCQAPTQCQMGQHRPPLRIRIEKYACEGYRREDERQSIEHCSGGEEDSR